MKSANWCKRAVLLSTPGQRQLLERIAAAIGSRVVGVFAGARVHTPAEVTKEALDFLTDLSPDLVVTIGGGSAIGLGKAIALRTDVAQIALPTTYSGSEMTPILGETEGGVKRTSRTAKVLPEVVIYDPELSLTLPVKTSGSSGMNAIAHAAEALYARSQSPVIGFMAASGAAAMVHSLQRIKIAPFDHEARAEALYGAWLCGSCLGMAGR